MAEKIYRVEGMDCANCARDLEKGISSLVGVQQVTVDFAAGKMHITGTSDDDTIRNRTAALGFKAIPPDTEITFDPSRKPGGIRGFLRYLLQQTSTRLALAGGFLILVAITASLVSLAEAISSAIYIAAILIALYPIARSGLNTLLINRDFNINLLMTIAAAGAIVLGEYLEGAFVVFLFAIGEALEGYTVERARSGLHDLMNLAPPTANRLIGDLAETVPVEDLDIGDMLIVKPAESIPMDGIVKSGQSAVNQAPITGESIPVHKAPGAEVFAGTINGDGALHVQVTARAGNNTLSRIIALVEEAQSSRAPSQRIIDQFARYYTPAMVILAAVIAFVPPLLFNAPFFNTGESHGWFHRALVLLVIACPCALVISTPVTIISAITAAARRGVLVKGGIHLEALATIRAVAFDKTGTLTSGQPQVQHYRSIHCNDDPDCTACEDVLALASAVEAHSTHPLAHAVTHAAEQHHLTFTPATGVQTLGGQGVRGYVENRLVTVGSHRYFDEHYPHDAHLCTTLQEAEQRGQTTMLVAQDDTISGYITAADTVRAGSRQVIAALRTMGLTTVMLTGDNRATAEAVGATVGVHTVMSELMPQDKSQAILQLREQHGAVAMVGDGINDTPALAAATVGIAMGGAGTAQALETANIALMSDDLQQLPYAIRLSRFARRIIRVNIGLSIALKLLVLLLALLGVASLWLAIAADVGTLLVVTLNGMRPLRLERRSTARQTGVSAT